MQLVYNDPAMDGPFDLKVEGILVCRLKSLRKAVIVFLGSPYVFNLAYSNTLGKAHIFVQKIMLKLSDNSEDRTRGRQFKDKYKAVLGTYSETKQPNKIHDGTLNMQFFLCMICNGSLIC